MKLKQNYRAGFSLIEMMVFMFIFSLAAITFYQSLVSGAKTMSNVKSRLDALAIANEKMEIIHNLNYEKIGTVNGFFTGELPDEEQVNQDNRTYWVHTSVVYVDDPFDGTATAGTDSKPDDYKQVKIQVFWDHDNSDKSVSLVSTIAPPGIESIYTGGILSLHVIDNSGNGIAGANVNITNSSLSPAVNVNLTTDSSGNLFLIEARQSSDYHISVTKSGYYSVQTYAPYPTSSVNPIQLNASVTPGQINNSTLMTDRVSQLILTTKSPLGDYIANIDYELTGGLQIAYTHDTNQPVYDYNNTSLNSGSDGSTTLSGMSSGPYFFTLKDTTANTDYEFLHMAPAASTVSSFNMAPNTAQEISAILMDKNVDSLLVTVVDKLDSTPLANATVELKDPNSSYDVTLQTDAFGQAYFPDSSGPLQKISYDLKVTSSGYADNEQSVSVSKLTNQQVELIAN